MVNKSAIRLAVKLVGQDHAQFLFKQATAQDRAEQKWMSEVDVLHNRITSVIVKSLEQTGKADVPDHMIFEFLLSHYFQTVGTAAEVAESELMVIIDQEQRSKLAKPRIPKSMRELREIYDRWRKTGRLPRGIRDMGEKIKDEYLKKTQSVWRDYSEEFREGSVATQENVLRKVKSAAGTANSRAKTIVRTETTNYYNDTRREIYDQSGAVTHYLFLAIRDQRTTKWCSDKVVDGKRGRHGLVYAKDDPITAKETPACHWNCRSEMVPLSPFNPRHLRLIEDLSKHRRNNVCHPLPKGWGNVA